MHDSARTDRDIVANGRGKVALNLGNMDDGAVANARVVADGNLVDVSADSRAVPDTTLCKYMYIYMCVCV